VSFVVPQSRSKDGRAKDNLAASGSIHLIFVFIASAAGLAQRLFTVAKGFFYYGATSVGIAKPVGHVGATKTIKDKFAAG
jgi:hypothetical protein